MTRGASTYIAREYEFLLRCLAEQPGDGHALRGVLVAYIGIGDGAIHDAGVYDTDDGLARRMSKTLRKLHGLVHLPDFSRGVAAEIFSDCGDIRKVARIKPRLAAVGS